MINSLIKAYRADRKRNYHSGLSEKKRASHTDKQQIQGCSRSLDENEGLRSLSVIFKEDVFEVKTSSPGILKDFDTKEDYLNELNKYL